MDVRAAAWVAALSWVAFLGADAADAAAGSDAADALWQALRNLADTAVAAAGALLARKQRAWQLAPRRVAGVLYANLLENEPSSSASASRATRELDLDTAKLQKAYAAAEKKCALGSPSWTASASAWSVLKALLPEAKATAAAATATAAAATAAAAEATAAAAIAQAAAATADAAGATHQVALLGKRLDDFEVSRGDVGNRVAQLVEKVGELPTWPEIDGGSSRMETRFMERNLELVGRINFVVAKRAAEGVPWPLVNGKRRLSDASTVDEDATWQ